MTRSTGEYIQAAEDKMEQENQTISDEELTTRLKELSTVNHTKEAALVMDAFGTVGKKYDNARFGDGFLAVMLLIACCWKTYAEAGGIDEELQREIMNMVKP